jgi:hypothetical protein
VSYFKVFGCKCFILNKRPRTSKFAPKVGEGFLLGYGPNEHAYQVFNLTTGRIEVMVDLTFDESNGSQVEKVDLNVVGNEKPSCEQSSNWP